LLTAIVLDLKREARAIPAWLRRVVGKIPLAAADILLGLESGAQVARLAVVLSKIRSRNSTSRRQSYTAVVLDDLDVAA
jgi:hypothetical protein